MNKKPIRLTESDLKQIVKDSVGNILKETRKKDPMRQWFKDMEDIQKHRDNMEYITKGGRKPKHWNESDLHRIVKESVNRILNEIGDTERGQYMLGRLAGRKRNNGDFNSSREINNYAMKDPNRSYYSRDYDKRNSMETSNDLGYNDETRPEFSKNMMNKNNNISRYQDNVRNNYLRGVSKF